MRPFQDSGFDVGRVLIRDTAEVMADQVTATLRRRRRHSHEHGLCHSSNRLGSYDEVEDYRRHNEYVITGYRMNYTWRQAFGSLWYMHNEVWNVWSHLVGCIVFIVIGIHSYYTWLAEGTVADKIFFLPWCIASVYCCFASSFFHLTDCLGEKWYQLGVRLDYTGIVALIPGSVS